MSLIQPQPTQTQLDCLYVEQAIQTLSPSLYRKRFPKCCEQTDTPIKLIDGYYIRCKWLPIEKEPLKNQGDLKEYGGIDAIYADSDETRSLLPAHAQNESYDDVKNPIIFDDNGYQRKKTSSDGKKSKDIGVLPQMNLLADARHRGLERRVVYFYANRPNKNWVSHQYFPDSLGKLTKLSQVWLQNYNIKSSMQPLFLALNLISLYLFYSHLEQFGRVG